MKNSGGRNVEKTIFPVLQFILSVKTKTMLNHKNQFQ